MANTSTAPWDGSSARRTDLAEIVRRRRVHFEVRPEVTIRDEQRLIVGYEIRIWAIHPKGAKALPGCVKCGALVEDLHVLARAVVPLELRPTFCAIEPPSAALYDSQLVPGADEICVTVRLVHRDRYDRPVDACEERCLKEIRNSLKALGAREA